jgi:hypothetical protein
MNRSLYKSKVFLGANRVGVVELGFGLLVIQHLDLDRVIRAQHVLLTEPAG